jgi:glucokinase
MEYIIKNYKKESINDEFSDYVLGIDIGGTNTNLAIAGIKDKKTYLLYSHNYKTDKLDSIIPAIDNILTFTKNEYNIEIDFACIGAAGIVSSSNDFVKLTNANWSISSNEIKNRTSLNSVYIINDFQAIGYGLNLLSSENKEDICTIRQNNINLDESKPAKAIIGAGTGLGKSILNYDSNFNAYIPIPSEGGHSDLPVKNDFEIKLVDFVKKLRNISQPLSYEEVLSGRGIESIYLFLRSLEKFNVTQYTNEIDESIDKTPLISKYRNIDETCKETFQLFTRFYARCAKNFVLDTLSRGGLYIAGGIASKNRDIFSSDEFINEFENAFNRTDLLKDIPISVIVNYDVSLYGACYAAMYKLYSKKP